MSDTENKCACDLSEEISETLPACSPCVQATLATVVKAAMEVALKHGCGCDCNGGNPTDPTDPEEGGVGEEYLLDTNMTSDAGSVNGFKPIASSFLGGTYNYYPWKVFQMSDSANADDCWTANIGISATIPQYIGLTTGDKKYVVTKVEIQCRSPENGSGSPQAPKEVNLKGLLSDGTWEDLTAHQTNPSNAWNTKFTIEVPESNRKPTTGVRLEIYSDYAGVSKEIRPIVARMRIWVKDVA